MNRETSCTFVNAKTDDSNSRMDIDDVCLDSKMVVCASERTRTTILSMLIAGILGWAIGVAQLIVIGSWDLFHWAFMPLIPLCSAFGWSLLGMIIGGSGLFSKTIRATKSETQPVYRMDIAA